MEKQFDRSDSAEFARPTLPGCEPGPSTDGMSPDGQGGVSFDAGTTWPVWPLVDFTASPNCRCGPVERAGYLPACKGSVDLSGRPDTPLPGTGGGQYVEECRSRPADAVKMILEDRRENGQPDAESSGNNRRRFIFEHYMNCCYPENNPSKYAAPAPFSSIQGAARRHDHCS